MVNIKTMALICGCMVLFGYGSVRAEEIPSRKSGLDLTFVVDHSGSMNANDSNRMGLGMVKAFVDTVYSKDIRIGFAAYQDQILSSTPPVPINTKEERNALKSLIDASRYSGNTDIGLGLKYAYGITDQEEGRKRILVLISDGETDLKGSATGRSMADSESDLAQTVTSCQNENVPVYTIAFGNYGKSQKVLKEIAEQTGGEHYTVEKPEALIDVLYGILNANMAYQIQGISDGVYAKGTQNIRMKLDESYASELNMLFISSQEIGDTLVQYGDYQYTADNLGHYATLKIPDADITDGVNELNIRTETAMDQELKVYLVSYRDLIPYLAIGPEVQKHVPVPFSIYFKDRDGNRVIDEAFYKDFACTAELYAEQHAQAERERVKTYVRNGVIEGEMTFDRSGTYYLDCRIEDVMDSSIFPSHRIQVGNTLPAGEIKDVKPYTVLTGERTLALKDSFTDLDGDALHYTISQNRGEAAKVTLADGVLSVKTLKPGEQHVILKISDGEGAISYSYTVTILPLWQAYWWLILFLLLIAVAVIFILFHKPKTELEQIMEKKAGNRFAGKMDAYVINQPGDSDEIPPLTFPMYKIRNSHICAGDLMRAYPELSEQLCLDHIFLIADEDRNIVLYHFAMSTVMIGSSIACRNLQYSIGFGDIVYVTSPNGAYELEIHYMR